MYYLHINAFIYLFLLTRLVCYLKYLNVILTYDREKQKSVLTVTDPLLLGDEHVDG